MFSGPSRASLQDSGAMLVEPEVRATVLTDSCALRDAATTCAKSELLQGVPDAG